MRNGSDYWRGGKLLSDVTGLLRADGSSPPAEVAYSRADEWCPGADLLERFRKTPQMTFGQYAQDYAAQLGSSGGLEHACARALLSLASGLLPVLYCVDPFVPGYGNSLHFGTPWATRSWQGPRDVGCHRVVLAEEMAKFFLGLGMNVLVIELDQSFQRVHLRQYAVPLSVVP